MSTKEPLNLKTFSEETAKSLNQEAEQYFDYKREPWTPKDRPLSLFYYIDAPAGVCGGGAVCVVWCDSEKELLEVLANYILITNPGPKPDFDDFQDVFNTISISVKTRLHSVKKFVLNI